MTQLTSLPTGTPTVDDIFYFVDAPSTVPVSKSASIQSLLNLFQTSIPYGSMYMEDATVNTTITNANTAYPITTGSTTGLCNGVTFQNACELKILTAGTYKVDWSMSLLVNSADQTIEGVVMGGAAGTTYQPQTANSTRAKESVVVYSVGGTGIMSCAVNDLIRLGLENETSAGKVITVNTANLAIIRLGA